MKLADLKRKVVVGIKLETLHYSGWNPGVREVVKVNSVGFGLKKSPTDDISWCDWPKANDIVAKENGFAIKCPWFNRGTQQNETVELLTYTFV